MLVKNCLYIIVVILNILSVPIFIYSIVNKNKKICKGIICMGLMYILYLFLGLTYVPYVLYINIGLEVVLLWISSFVSGLFYTISIIICLVKIKKNKSDSRNLKKLNFVIPILIILPILFFGQSFLREYYILKNSDLVLVYHSAGVSSLGFDDQNFCYAINDDYCIEISLGIWSKGDWLKNFLPKNSIRINNIEELNYYGYDVKLDSEGIFVYKNGILIHNKQHKSGYFNDKFERGFYTNK